MLYTCRLEYDIATNTYRNLSGIEISVPNFGDDVAFNTYQKFIDYLQNEHGYTSRNVRLAPYDWRLAPRKIIPLCVCMSLECPMHALAVTFTVTLFADINS